MISLGSKHFSVWMWPWWEWSTWWTGMCEIVVSGEELLNASERLIHAAKHWKGSSADNHPCLPSRGLSVESNISSKWFSINATQPSYDNLSSRPAYKFSKCIFSQCKLDFPRRRPSTNSRIPQHKSEFEMV